MACDLRGLIITSEENLNEAIYLDVTCECKSFASPMNQKGRNKTMSKCGYVALGLWAGLFALRAPATAAEIPIGDPVEQNGMEIAAVYLQAITMEPAEPEASPSDIHLEADIHAIPGNANGFGAGEWIPHLEIAYQIEKVGTDWSTHGSFMPMIAADGPHYGANVALDGPGQYKLNYEIVPPIRNAMYRHTDKETGVGNWWAPFHVEWTFAYVGTGKKGAY